MRPAGIRGKKKHFGRVSLGESRNLVSDMYYTVRLKDKCNNLEHLSSPTTSFLLSALPSSTYPSE